MDRSASGTAWPEIRRVLKKGLARAGSGGLPGAMAGLLQVVTLMWLRTIVNYQCRYGTSIGAAASELYRQGGVLRFYRGVVFALVSNPMSRFGMAAANEGAIALTDALPRQVYNYLALCRTSEKVWACLMSTGIGIPTCLSLFRYGKSTRPHR